MNLRYRILFVNIITTTSNSKDELRVYLVSTFSIWILQFHEFQRMWIKRHYEKLLVDSSWVNVVLKKFFQDPGRILNIEIGYSTNSENFENDTVPQCRYRD